MGRRNRSDKPRTQTTVRADRDVLERMEERALEETLRLGVPVCLADLIRRGMDLVLAEPLPGRPAKVKRCMLTTNSIGGSSCIECKRSWPSTYSQQQIMEDCGK